MPKKIPARIAILFPVALFALSACSARVTVHGYAPDDFELLEVEPGIDTIFSLEERIGRPATSGLLDDNTWYYVQTTVEHFTFYPPKVIDRKVVAIDFEEDGVVTDVVSYGLEDGRVINLNTRITETDAKRVGIISALFGNIGGLTADQLLGDN